MADSTSEAEEAAAEEDSASSKPSPRKRRKTARTIAGPASDTSTTASAGSPHAPIPAAEVDSSKSIVIPSLRAPLVVPVELLSLGISAWVRKRQSSTEDAGHRDALDDALAELMWQLADQLTDGERLDLPEFQQARRSASRSASAAHNAQMEGERQCTIMLGMLDKLAQTS